MYARARLAQADALAEEVLDTARASTGFTAHADRVKTDALRWVAGKLNARRYGDRQQVEINAKVEHTRGPDRAPEWMQERLAPPPPQIDAPAQAEALGEAIPVAVQHVRKPTTTH